MSVITDTRAFGNSYNYPTPTPSRLERGMCNYKTKIKVHLPPQKDVAIFLRPLVVICNIQTSENCFEIDPTIYTDTCRSFRTPPAFYIA